MAITVTAWKKDGTGYWIKGDPIVETVADLPEGRRLDEQTGNVHGAAPPANVAGIGTYPQPPTHQK